MRPMSTDLRTKLTSERAPATWRDLEASGQLASLVLVEAALDLVDAGIALAENDVARVKGWLESGALRKPEPLDLSTWRAAPETAFEMLIVQPFVLVQRAATH